MTEQFGDTPETFDLDAWIDQGTRPRREVTIYQDWKLLEEYDRLEAQLPAEGGVSILDEAMGDEGPESIRAQMAEIIERIEASGLTFSVQAITSEEIKELTIAAPTKTVDLGNGTTREKVDEVELGAMMLAKAIISPAITADQVQRLRKNLGDGPVNPLFAAAKELRNAGQELPTVPSSREH